MQAGRELDALIAERVMGWKPYCIVSYNILYPPRRQESCDAQPYVYRPFNPDKPYEYDSEHFYDSRRGGPTEPIVPPYSTQIADAWLVVEKMQSNAWAANVLTHEADDNMCEFWKLHDLNFPVCVNHQASVPLAICLAALKAVE